MTAVTTAAAAAAIALLAASAATASAQSTSLSMADTADWAFVGPKWSQTAGSGAEPSWIKIIKAPGSPRAKQGNVAIYIKQAFVAPCNITLSFIQGSTWTTAALVVGASNLTDGYFLIDVPTEGQEFRTENTFVTVSRANSAGWREGVSSATGAPFIGPVPGVSSVPNLAHQLRAELSEGAVALWLDRQPLGTVALPGLSLPAHIGLASYSMLGAGPIAQFHSVTVDGPTVAPRFDAAAPGPSHSWIVATGSPSDLVLDTTSIGNAVVLPGDKSVVALNKGMVVQTTDRAATWGKLSAVPATIHGGKLLYNPQDSTLAIIGVKGEPPPPPPPPGSKHKTPKVRPAGPATMLRAVSTDNGRSFSEPTTVGVINTTLWGDAAKNVSLGGFDTILPLTSRPGTVLVCGGGYSPQTLVTAKCPADLSGIAPPTGCSTDYLGVSERAGFPALSINYCMRSETYGASWAGPVDITTG